jgi:formiminotetrahydrofolate cyclodeaminase
MRYLEQSVEKYIEDLGAKLPAPGGGSAAAFSVALGIALLEMVANFTVGKEASEEDKKRLGDILPRIKEAKKDAQKYIDEDVAAYGKVREAYKTPKEEPGRKEKIEKATKAACNVAVETAKISQRAISLARTLVEIGNKNLITDVVIGALLIKAGFESSMWNVDINLHYIKDKDFGFEVKTTLEPAKNEINAKFRKIEDKTKKILGERKLFA